jgi:nickel transport protein
MKALPSGFVLVLGGLTAAAHGLEVAVESAGRAVIVRAAYSAAEPCGYAAVLVYSPAGGKTEFQNGRTDANGRFSFVPDQPGAWRFVVDDEIGHRKEISIPARAPAGPAAGSESLPSWQKALTGGSLLAGLTGLLYGWTSRRPR